MATPFQNPTFPLNRPYTITPGVSGLIGVLGNIDNLNNVGLWTVQFQPSGDSDATFVVVGRAYAPQSTTTATPNDLPPQGGYSRPWLPVPYQRVYGAPGGPQLSASSANAQALDYNFVTDQITGNAIIVVPSAGMEIGLMISCSQGTATVWPTFSIGVASI